jgi:hypothetical protein
MAITEAWLRDHLPDCHDPVLLHGDYRKGNFAARQSRSESATIRIRKFSQAADGWRATPASHQRPEKMATLVPLSGELSSVIALVR